MPHTPERMCVICRERFAKAALTRFVQNAQGDMEQDTRQCMAGRGYYVCDAAGCREKMRTFSPKKRKNRAAK